MTPWLFTGVVTLGVAVIGLVGAAVGSAINARVARHRDDVTAEHQMIDQLQEELGKHRAAQDQRSAEAEARMTAQDTRMNRLETYVDGYRDYAHTLRAYIYDGGSPPPPQWPEGLPR